MGSRIKHGNIRTINRGGIYQHGWNYIYPNHTYGVIDNMTLSYNGNQLDNAIDLASDPLYYGSQDFKDTTATNPGTEYHYDTNGNLTDDSNKGIVTIRSNWLNLPDTVQMENGDMASYTYSPSGDKFMCIYSTANTSTVTMPLGTTLSNGRPAGITVAQSLFMIYMDNVVYEGNPWSTTLHNLGKVLTDDGILVRTNSVTQATPVFERNYYVRDHLGNVRVVFDSQGRVRQLNNYTPFGMEYGESAGDQASVGYQDYKFGGKELDRRFELNWYNFGARSYDLALGRWTSVDPLAEKYYSVSPYVYCANNPMRFVDFYGDSLTIHGSEKEYALEQTQLPVKNELKLTMDASGKVEARQTILGPLTEKSQSLLNICSSSDVRVDLLATDSKRTSNGKLLAAGSFMGNSVTFGETGYTGVAFQEVNPMALDLMSFAFGRPGAEMLHEITEAYQGALISMVLGKSSPCGSEKGSVYPEAHSRAYPSSGTLYRINYDKYNKEVITNNQASRADYYVFPNGNNGKALLINSIYIK